MFLNKKIMLSLLGIIFLVSCSSSDEESSSGSNTENLVVNETNSDNESRVTNANNLPATEADDSCDLNNYVLSPPSGSTLSISEDDGIDITLDVQLNQEFENLLFEAELDSIDSDDEIAASFNLGQNKGPGRVIITERFNFSRFTEPDNYTTLTILPLNYLGGEEHQLITGCGAIIPVNYIITP